MRAPAFAERLRGFARVAGLVGACGAASVLAGWLVPSPILTSPAVGFAATVPNTALCLLVMGCALYISQGGKSPLWRAASASFALLLALVSIGQDLLGYDAHIDTLLVRAARSEPDAVSYRMSPLTGAGIALLAVALLLLRRRLALCTQTFAAIVGAGASVVLLGYLFDAPALYQLKSYASVPVYAAALLLLLASGVLAANANHGWVAEFAADTPSAAMARRLTGSTFLLLPMLGWLSLTGQSLGWFSAQIGVALLVPVSLTVLTVLTWTLTHAANRAEWRLQPLDRLYRAVSSVSQLIVRCRDRDELLREAARIARDEGGLPVAWVSLIEATPEQAESPLPADRPMVVNDVRRAPDLTDWRATAQARGVRSMAALPIEVDEALAGVFVFGAHKRNFFIGAELQLLHEIAGEVGFALTQLNGDARRRSAEAALADLAVRLQEQVAARTAELQAANAELEALSYNVSHDLRSPLRTMDGYSQLVEEDYGDKLDDMGRHLLRMIRNASRRMGQLVDDLLAFSRLGRQPLHTVQLDMAALVAEVWAELRRGATDDRIEFTVALLPAAQGDLALLRQVWINLLANAVKYTGKRERARIGVTAHVEGTEVIYRVVDDGVGFDMRYAEKLFKVFQRLHTEAEFPGTGIGLAIVQRIVARHGGRVGAEGRLDDGATFWFSLPLHPR